MSGGGCCCGTRRDAGTFGRGPESLARLWERDGGERERFSTVAVVVEAEAEVVVVAEAVVVSERFQLCVDLVVSLIALLDCFSLVVVNVYE